MALASMAVPDLVVFLVLAEVAQRRCPPSFIFACRASIWLSVQLVSEIACTSDMRRATSRRYAAPAPRAARLLTLWYVRVASATQGLGSV